MGIEDRKAREFRRRETEILEATLRLAGESDWPSVTIDDIANSAEIGKGTFYMHFKSKDEVCARLVVDHAQQLLEKVQAFDPGMEYIPRFKRILKTIWHHTMAKREILALKMYCDASESALNLSEDFARVFVETHERMEGFMRSLVEEGIQRGILAPQPIQFQMFAGWSTMMGAMRLNQAVFFQDIDQETLLDYMTDYILKGMMNAQVSVSAA